MSPEIRVQAPKVRASTRDGEEMEAGGGSPVKDRGARYGNRTVAGSAGRSLRNHPVAVSAGCPSAPFVSSPTTATRSVSSSLPEENAEAVTEMAVTQLERRPM